MRWGRIALGLGVAIALALVWLFVFLWRWGGSPAVQGGACDPSRPRACADGGVIACAGPGTKYALAEACTNCWDDLEGLAECAKFETPGTGCFAGTVTACAVDRVTLVLCDPKTHRWVVAGLCAPGTCNVEGECVDAGTTP